MSKTSDIIQKTLQEIENTAVTTDSKPRTAEEIKNILLNTSGNNELLTTQHSSAIPSESASGNDYCFDFDTLKRHKEDCNRQYNVPYYRGIMPSWKRFNRPVIFMKRIIRKLCRSLIEPIVEQQNDFNASAVNTLNALYNNEIVTQAFILQQQTVNAQILALHHQLQEEQNTRIAQLTSELVQLTEHNTRLQQLSEHLDQHSEYIEQLSDLLNQHSEGLAQHSDELGQLEEQLHQLEEKTASSTGYEDIDYFDFETNFRGSQLSVKERLKDYVPYFPKNGTVVDLGCGRGEFLELLDENEITAIGVDTYAEFVDYCTHKGLHVVNENAIDYMDKLDEQSLSGVFAAQLVEHLSINELTKLCNLSYQKLAPGGVLIFETPNPTNVSTYLNGFYMDPTHHNPVHPKSLEYLLKKAGFKEVDIIFTEQSRIDYRLPLLNASGVQNLSEFNDGINFLSDIIFGSQDYAVIARK